MEQSKIIDTLETYHPPAATFYPFSTNDLVLIQFVLRFPIISLFNQETGWVSSLYYFHHIISSLNQVLDSCYNFPPFLCCLNKALDLNA